jgi:hypothetical protein
VAGEYIGAANGNAFVHARAAIGEDLVEDGAQGEHGRPAVHLCPPDGHTAHFAARASGLFDNGYVEAARGKQGGADQPSNTRTNDDHALIGHGRLSTSS